MRYRVGVWDKGGNGLCGSERVFSLLSHAKLWALRYGQKKSVEQDFSDWTLGVHVKMGECYVSESSDYTLTLISLPI